MTWMLALLARGGVSSPLMRGLVLGLAAVLAAGSVALAVRAGVHAILDAKFREGYAAAAAECREAQLETRVASLTRDLDQARKQADREQTENQTLRRELNEVQEENARYETERIELGSHCPADDPAVAHDRRLRGRGQAPAR